MFLSSGDRGQSTGYTLSRRSKNTHCFIIDCNPQFWSANPCFVEIIDSILMFSRSLSISGDIPLIFMLTSPISTKLIFQGNSADFSEDAVKDAIFTYINDFDHQPTRSIGSLMSAPITQSLCILRRHCLSTSGVEGRIMIFEAFKAPIPSFIAYASEFVALANSGTAAKSIGVVIDVVGLGGRVSPLLKRLAAASDGICLSASSPLGGGDLLSRLLFSFSVPPALRNVLRPLCDEGSDGGVAAGGRSVSGVESAALCFCHHRSVQRAVCCPGCFGVFCSLTMDACPVCKISLVEPGEDADSLLMGMPIAGIDPEVLLHGGA